MPRKKTAIKAEILTNESVENEKGINVPQEEVKAVKKENNEFYPKSNYEGYDLVGALRNAGIESSYGFRSELYKANGYENYLGLGRDNKILLDLFKEGKLKRVKK